MVRIWSSTWKVQIVEPPEMVNALFSKSGMILAHWHRHELSLLPLFSKYKAIAMVSKSKDGEIMAFVVNRLGGQTLRGSSSRGAVGALKGLVRALNQNEAVTIAVDGPRGPIYQIKPGVFELARLTGKPIFFGGASSNSNIHFNKSWNKAFLPRPFARVNVIWKGPFFIDKTQDPRDLALAAQMAEVLDSITDETQNSLR